MSVPIWKDIIVEEASATPQPFSVYADLLGTFYHGTSHPVPGTSPAKLRIRINDLIAGIGGNPFPDVSQFIGAGTPLTENIQAQLMPYFSLYINGVSKWAGVVQAANWSYEYGWNNYDHYGYYPQPLRREVSPRMPLLWTKCFNNVITVNSSGGPFTITGPTAGHSTNFLVPVPAGYTWIDIDGVVRWEVKECGRRYALYYVNKFGFWDFVLMTAGVELQDYDRGTYSRDYDNGRPEARGKVNYRTGVTRKWELHTGALDDLALSRIDNLIGSTKVYLYDCDGAAFDGNGDLDTLGPFYPVIITDSSWRERSYEMNGRTPVTDITVTVELAQNVIRR